jgi:hypothetical protein
MPPKTTAGPVCLWLPRLPLGVWDYFDFVGASERLSHMGTTHRKRTWRVGRVFPCRVYIDLNRRDSRI